MNGRADADGCDAALKRAVWFSNSTFSVRNHPAQRGPNEFSDSDAGIKSLRNVIMISLKIARDDKGKQKMCSMARQTFSKRFPYESDGVSLAYAYFQDLNIKSLRHATASSK